MLSVVLLLWSTVFGLAMWRINKQMLFVNHQPFQVQKRLPVMPESRYCYKLWLAEDLI